jgi:hypothetical protein
MGMDKLTTKSLLGLGIDRLLSLVFVGKEVTGREAIKFIPTVVIRMQPITSLKELPFFILYSFL